jgi:glycerol-3-phosphate dehydrogenase
MSFGKEVEKAEMALEKKSSGEQGPREYNVVIIGAGIIGSAIARELSRYEGKVALLDKEPFPGFGVTKSGISMIHSPLMCPPGTLKEKLCMGATARYKKLAVELKVEFKEVDELFLALDPSHLANLETLWKRGRGYGLEGCEIIAPEEIHRQEPHITPKALSALVVRGLGSIYPPEWAFALSENACENGVHLHFRTPVTGIEKTRDFSYVVHTGKESFKSRFIINVAGLFADDIAAMVGDHGIELTLTKGTMAIFDKSVSHLLRHMVYGTFSGAHSQMMTQTVHGNLMIGLGHFSKPEHKRDTSVTPDKLQEIIRMAKELVPNLPEGEIISTFAGIRSENNRAAKGDFYIAHSPKAPGVIHGLIGSPGLTAAPAIAEQVIKMLGEAGLELIEKRSFRKERKEGPRLFDPSFERRRSMIALTPGYGRMVCRCEQVTEGEIEDAIQRGADTLDGIKHLTRAGMGRCQGGYCSLPVMGLLARQLGVGLEQVTKKGGMSFQVFSPSTQSKNGKALPCLDEDGAKDRLKQ